MTKAKKTDAAISVAEAPRSIAQGETSADMLARLRVVDADTGATIHAVIAADVDAGTVKRFEADDAGNLKRDGDRFVIVEEARSIRIEWAESAA